MSNISQDNRTCCYKCIWGRSKTRKWLNLLIMKANTKYLNEQWISSQPVEVLLRLFWQRARAPRRWRRPPRRRPPSKPGPPVMWWSSILLPKLSLSFITIFIIVRKNSSLQTKATCNAQCSRCQLGCSGSQNFPCISGNCYRSILGRGADNQNGNLRWFLP